MPLGIVNLEPQDDRLHTKVKVRSSLWTMFGGSKRLIPPTIRTSVGRTAALVKDFLQAAHLTTILCPCSDSDCLPTTVIGGIITPL
jgi:hypothetical protein